MGGWLFRHRDARGSSGKIVRWDDGTENPVALQDYACASPKFCPALKSTACILSSATIFAMTRAHFPLRRIMGEPAYPLLSIGSKPAPGKSRSPATAGRAEAQASQTPDGDG
jgi:hypothetical protein